MSEASDPFLRWPSLGGWLAILNCASWVGLFLSQRAGWMPYEAFLALVIPLSLPVAFPFILPQLGPPNVDDIVVKCLAIGVNAFVQGYALAWFWRRLFGVSTMSTEGDPTVDGRR